MYLGPQHYYWHDYIVNYFKSHGLTLSTSPEYPGNYRDYFCSDYGLYLKNKALLFCGTKDIFYRPEDVGRAIALDVEDQYYSYYSKPAAYIVISYPTSHMVAVPYSTNKMWQRAGPMMTAPPESMRPIHSLINKLKSIEAGEE